MPGGLRRTAGRPQKVQKVYFFVACEKYMVQELISTGILLCSEEAWVRVGASADGCVVAGCSIFLGKLFWKAELPLLLGAGTV